MIEVSWPGPAVPRSRRSTRATCCSSPAACASSTAASSSRASSSTSAPTTRASTIEGRVLSVYPATEGLSFKVIRSIIDAHLDALLPLVAEYLPDDVLEAAGVPPHRRRAAAWCIGRVDRRGDARDVARSRSRSCSSCSILHRRAKDLARETREGIRFDEQARAHDAACESCAAVRRSPARRCARRARSSPTWRATAACTGCCRATSAAARRSSRCSRAARRSRTAIRRRSWRRPSCSPSSTRGRSSDCSRRSASRRFCSRGACRPSARKAIARLASGEPLLVVGTHALVQEATRVRPSSASPSIDEQHRFGVEQREGARRQGRRAPTCCSCRATPIPRSLALTLYGDLDVSVLDERPPGRQPITTALRPESARERVLQFVDRQVEKGRQAYVVYPVIEESEKTRSQGARRRCTSRSPPARSRTVASRCCTAAFPATSATTSCAAFAMARSTSSWRRR